MSPIPKERIWFAGATPGIAGTYHSTTEKAPGGGTEGFLRPIPYHEHEGVVHHPVYHSLIDDGSAGTCFVPPQRAPGRPPGG